MTSDKETLAYYDAHAAAYAELPQDEGQRRSLDEFLAQLPEGGAVLDLGCGTGWASAAMSARGYHVTPMDGSLGMVEEARRRTGLDVQHRRFDELDDHNLYDGVFASFSLLHLTEQEAGRTLQRVWRALRPRGVLFVGVKRADEAVTERRDRLGRFYVDYTPDGLEAMLSAAQLDVFWRAFGSAVGMDGVMAQHLYVLARRLEDG